MCRAAIAGCVVLLAASVAWAGAVVELTASDSANPFNPPGYYGPGETVIVELHLTQSAGAEHLVRLVQLDFSATDAALAPSSLGMTWDVPADRHYFEDGGLPNRSAFRSVVYYGDPGSGALGPDPAYQVVLPDDVSLKVGEFELTMPAAPGDYALDAMNAGDSDENHGTKLTFGFGLDAGDCGGQHADCQEPVTTWRAGAELTGGTYIFHVVDQNLTASVPEFDKSLWRSENNTAWLTFSDALAAAPNPGEVQIRQLLPDGLFGGDLSASFTFAVEQGNIVAIKESGTVLAHRTWYAISNAGDWAEVTPFLVHYVVQVGDANNDGRVTSGDASLINTGIVTPNADDDDRREINGDDRITNGDTSMANSKVLSLPVPKPSGH